MSEIVSAAERLNPLVRELRPTEQDRRIAAPIEQAIRDKTSVACSSTAARHRGTHRKSGCAFWRRWRAPRRRCPGWSGTPHCPAYGRASWTTQHASGSSATRSACSLCSTRPTGQAVPAASGFRLSGRWSLVSGCELADYLFLMSLVHEGVRRACSLPASPTSESSSCPRRLHHPGHLARRRLTGIGSHDVVVDDVSVPAGDTLAPGPPTGTTPLVRLPIIPTMVAGLGAQFLGMARTALDVTIDILRTKVSVDTGASVRERPSVLADIASHSAAVIAAGNHLRACMTRVWDDLEQRLPTPEDRATLFSAGLHAGAVARDCVAAMHAAAGLRRSTSTVHWSAPYAT